MTWLPYELHPETPVEGRPRGEYFRRDPERARQAQEYLQQRAQELGLEMNTPPVIANSRRALLLAEYARDHDRFDPVNRALFAAYWVDGCNLADESVLREVAAGAGLDPDDALAAVARGEGSERVSTAMDQAAAAGITGTPSFIVDDRYLIVGAQPYEWMLQAMRQIASENGAAGSAADPDQG